MDTTFLNYFWQLASLDVEERQNAAKELIIHLHKSYQQFSKFEKVSDFKDIRDFSGAIEIIKKVGGPDVAYAMLRLTKGITSPRAGARHGFALALTELLASFEFFTFKMILPLIDKNCPMTSSKDKEGSDKIFGRVLSFVSVMRSGILWRETSSDEDYREVINGLLACANCKPYVRETCYQVIVSSIPSLKKTSFDEKAISHLITVMKERSDKSGGINNPDDVNLAIVIEAQYPDIIQSSQWKQVMVHNVGVDSRTAKWHKPHILHPKNLEKLTEAIQAKSSKSATEIQQNQENRIHSVWDTILCWIISPSNDKPGNQTVTFEQFWKVVVDECLFDSDTTHQRKFWGFQLFEKALKLCPEKNTSSLFTPNFMRTLINNSYEKNRYLHEAAIRSLKVIEQVSDENHQKALVIVKQFLGQYYDQDFDKTSANIVKRILSVVNNQTIEECILYLKSIFIQPSENLSGDSDTTEQQRQWIINYLYSLLKDSRINRQEGWLCLVLELFLIYGFYIAKDTFINDKPKNNKVEISSQNKKLKKRDSKRVRFEDQQNAENNSNTDNSQEKITENILPKAIISENTQQCCRARFFHALGELSTFRSLQSDKTEKPVRTRGGFMSDDQSWAFYAVTLMNKFENDSQLEPLIVLSEEALRLKKAAVELLQKITKKLEGSKNEGSQKSNLYIQLEGFHWLFSYAILTLYIEPEEAMNALEDLQVCFNKMFVQSKRSLKKKKTEKTEENAEENHDPIDVIVDVLLSFLAKPSAFLHNMTEQAFKVFCGGITKSSLDLMLDLISKKGNVEELVDEMDIDEENNDDSSDESIEHDSDNEETDNEKREVKDQSVIEIGQQDKQHENEDSEEDQSNQDKIMEEFDSKLSEFFKQKKFEKKKRKDAKYQRIHYKHKVIGLLKIFVKEQPHNPLIFELIVPLLEISKNAKTDEIAKSAFDLSTKIIVIKDGPTEFDENKVLTLLEKVQDMARKSSFGDMMKLCWNSSAFLLKSMVRRYKYENIPGEVMNQQHIKKAIAIYESTYKSWCVKSNSLNIKCFSQLPNHIPQIPWHLSEIFLGCADPKIAKNPNKVMNAYDVSYSILNIALPKKSRESESVNSTISKLVPKIREALNNTLQFVAGDLKCGDQTFDSQTLKSILKFASFAIKRTSVKIPIEERKKLWNAKNFLLLLEKIKELPRFKSSQAINGLVKEITRNF
ncbi:hypothetical protein RhiirC2_849581 [Rhizophagus irregularis]|uniref:DNA-directed DNA polymerase n=1 Tax=Rhizophagus irregularis TaxID=588596 RepID=A0A2N1NAB7_9GLOM|nr:hypothetical protein RhiirC2_849581 [Rhizophagus irregularis]